MDPLKPMPDNKMKFDDLIADAERFLEQEKFAEAIYVATKATEIEGNNARAWSLLAKAKYHWNEIDDAIYEYKKAIRLESNNPFYYSDLASIYESITTYELAEENYQKAIEIDNGNLDFKVSLAILYINIQQYEKAIGILGECLSNDCDNELIGNLLGLSYHKYVVSSFMVSASEDHYFVDNEECASSALEHINRALTLDISDEEVIQSLESDKMHLEWSIKKH